MVANFVLKLVLMMGLFIASTSQASVSAETTDQDFDKTSYTIAYSAQSFPRQFVDKNGEIQGLMKDYWLLWADKQQVKVEFVPMSWLESLQQVADGSVDFHAGLDSTADRQSFLTFSNSILSTHSYIYVNKEAPIFSSPKQLTPFTVGLVKGSSLRLSVLKTNPNIRFVEFNTRNEMYDAALAREIFAFSDVERHDDTYSKLNELDAQFPNFRRLSVGSNVYAAATNKKNVALIDFINQGIEKITDTELSEIKAKWAKSDQQNSGLNIAFSDNLPPYMGHSISGKPQGLYIDIWRLWSKYSGMPVNFIGESMARSVEQVRAGNLDAHLAYPEQTESTTGLIKAAKIHQIYSQVFVQNKYRGVTKLEQLAGKNLGIFKTSPYVEKIKQQYPMLNLKFYSGHIDMIQAAERGDVDAVVTEVENMKVKLVNANLQSLFYRLDQPKFEIEMFSLVAPDNKPLAALIQQGFNKIPLEELKEVESTWLGDNSSNYFNTLSKKAAITDEQRHWVLENPVLKVGVVKDWEPLEFVDEFGEVKGINRDLIEAVTERVGLATEFYAFDSWNLLFNAFRREEVDVVLGISDNEKNRDALLDFSNVYWEMPWSIIHQKSLGKIKRLNDFNGKQLAIVKGYQIAERIRKNYPSIHISVVESVEEGMLAVQQSLVDGFVESLPVASRLTTRETLTPLTVSVVPDIPLEPSTIAVRKSDSELKSILNAGLEHLSTSDRQSIFDRWFKVEIQTGLDQRWVVKVAAQIGLVLAVFIGVVIFWNQKLRQEVSRRIALEEQMKHMATHDELTGIPNRNLMKTQMEQAIAMHQRQHIKLAVLFVDLDGFKMVNDQFGHDFGDKVLKNVSSRLIDCIRKSDTVCRFGGDEFVILLTGLNNREEAAYIAEKVIEAVGQPYEIEDQVAELGCSIGISMFPEDGDNETDLLKMADTLMYRVKESGKNNYLYR